MRTKGNARKIRIDGIRKKTGTPKLTPVSPYSRGNNHAKSDTESGKKTTPWPMNKTDGV
jgi:hypothetical protein